MKKKSESTRSLKEVMEGWTERSAQASAKEQLVGDKKIVKLPPCKDSERTIPNIVARSALFGAIRRGARLYKDKALIGSRGDVEIYYTGKTLDQADCTVWMQALNIASNFPLGTDISIKRSNFLASIGRSSGKTQYKWLNDSFHRLKMGGITVKNDKYILEVSLIDMWFLNEKTGEYILNISPKVIAMWSNSQYTKVEWGKRLAIKRGADLASWLQLYVRSHAITKEPHHIGLEKLREWCGRSDSKFHKFRSSMKQALQELERIGEIKSSSIRKDGMVIFTRIADRDSNTLWTKNDRDSNTNDRHSLPEEHRHSLPEDRHSLPEEHRHSLPEDRHSLPEKHRHSLPEKHRHSLPEEHRHSLPEDRHSLPKDRHSLPKDRHSLPGGDFKSMILKAISRLFFP